MEAARSTAARNKAMAPTITTGDSPATDAWNEKDQRIEVTEGAGPNSGPAIGLRLRAKIEGSPALVYQILTDPNCVEVFRNIKVGAVPCSIIGFIGRLPLPCILSSWHRHAPSGKSWKWTITRRREN